MRGLTGAVFLVLIVVFCLALFRLAAFPFVTADEKDDKAEAVKKELEASRAPGNS